MRPDKELVIKVNGIIPSRNQATQLFELLSELNKAKAEENRVDLSNPSFWKGIMGHGYLVTIHAEEGVIIGMAILIRTGGALKNWTVQEVIVHKNYRRRGIGWILIKKIMNIAKEKGISKIFLTTSKKPAKLLYLSAGFNQIGSTEIFCVDL